MNEEAYHNRSGSDLWIRSDQIWYPELRMRSANVWDMTTQNNAIIDVYMVDASGNAIRTKTSDLFLTVPILHRPQGEKV
jgi:hypothetical protein